MTAGIFCALNGYTYWKLQRQVKKQPLHETAEFKVAFGNFQTRMHQLNTYLSEQRINLEQCLHAETQRNGLVIIDAYYGLDEHIYRIDSGKLFEL